MKILLAANERMRDFTVHCLRSAQKFGYSALIYDLGGLGFGKPFLVEDRNFQEKGYYHEITKYRYAPGEHKPAVIRDCLRSENELIVYLDADTLILNKIDDMAGDYDVGLTVRPQWEITKLLKKYHPDNYFIYDGYVNTGVMCFNNTPGTYRFLKKWEEGIARLHDEQGAINDMLQYHIPLESGRTLEIEGIKIRTFDTMHYNYYYFHSSANSKAYPLIKEDLTVDWQDAKILHFKGKMRQEYARILSLINQK